MLPRRTGVILLSTASVLACLSFALLAEEEAPNAIHEGFESSRPVWRQEQTDATVNLLAHDRSKRAVHDGKLAEHFKFVAGSGSSFFYSYPLPKIPVTETLRVGLFVRSNRAGIRLFARVVLPSDTDPDTRQASFVLVPGTTYENTDRWQRLELSDFLPSMERQARVLRATSRRPVSLEGAYVERLVVNLFGGTGDSEVFIDDLTISPVPAQVVAQHQPAAPTAPEARPEVRPEAPESATVKGDRHSAQVALVDNRLKRRADDGQLYDWLFTAIQAPGVDPKMLREAGFDVLSEGIGADPKRIKEAVKHGFMLMPNLATTLEGRPVEAERMIAEAKAYPFRDKVAFWNIGDQLGRGRDLETRKAELDRIRATVTGLRDLPDGVSPLTLATIDGDHRLFANRPKNISLFGVRPNPWGSAQAPLDTYFDLKQHRELTALANASSLFFAWIPVTPPAATTAAIWGQETPPAWGVPQVQPEQVRLNTYIALGAGYRGLIYHADSKLTGLSGRMLLIEMAFLNHEIKLCESILANGSDPIPLYNTYVPDPSNIPTPGSRVNMRMPILKELEPNPTIRAAGVSTRDRKGTLLLVADYAQNAQYQPSQMAMNDLKITLMVPEASQAFEITPGEVRPLDRERVPGGIRITVPDFSVTSLILVTTDYGLVGRLVEQVTRVRPKAVQLAIEQARLQLQGVSVINGMLMQRGLRLYNKEDPKTPPIPEGAPVPNDEQQLLSKAEESLKAAMEAQEREDYPLAWSEARRASRPLRHLMINQWAKIFQILHNKFIPPDPKPQPTRTGRPTNKDLTAIEMERRRRTPYLVLPIDCPPMVSYYTLPVFDYWLDWLGQPFGRNLVPSGSFDSLSEIEAAGWIDQCYQYEGIIAKVSHVPDPDDGRKGTLTLSVAAKDKKQIDTLIPFMKLPAAAIRTPAIRMERGELYRISVLVKKDYASPQGIGGITITDSIGGEPMQFRTSSGMHKLSRVVLYRRAPSKGMLTVTLGLAGFGEAIFEDFRVERLDIASRVSPDEYANRQSPRRLTVEDIIPPATATRPLPSTRSSQ